jgi:autotransporter-associated beta strand protein
MIMKKIMALACMALVLFTAGTSLAETYYWDSNTNSAGFGIAQGAWAAPTIPSGTQGWTTNSAGSTALNSVTTATSDSLNFGNGGTGLAIGTITIIGTVNAGDLTFASGSGAITLQTGRINLAPAVTITLNNAADTISGVLDGAATSLTKQGTGTLTLSYNANQFTGPTVISNGKVKLSAQYALWKSPYDTTGSTGAIGLDVTGQVAPVLGGLAGNVDLMTGVTAYNAVTSLTLNPQTGYSVSYGGVIANGSGAMTLTKTGDGAQTLTGVNSYSGATTIYDGTLGLGGAAGSALNSAFTVRGGTLSLDNSAGWTNRLADGTALSLGSLTLTSSNGAGITNETVGATTFGTSGKVTVNNGSTAGDQTTLALGNVTRSAGAAIDFAGTGLGSLGGGADSPNVTSTSWPALGNGILAWATANGTNWAATGANGIVAYSGTFVDPTSATSDSTTNAQLTGTGSIGTAKAFNSLNTIASASGQSLSLGANLNLTSGGLLKSGTDSYTISGSGTLGAGAAGAGTELIAHVDGGDLTVSAPLDTDIVNLAKGGTGNLILSGTRAGAMGAISLAGGQLEFQGAGTTLTGAVSGPGGLTVNLNAGQILLFNSTAITYSGPTVVKGGILQIGNGYGAGNNFSVVPGATMESQGQGVLSNLELNGGTVSRYWYGSNYQYLGSGPGQIQLTGGTCGLSNLQGDRSGTHWIINNDLNYEVVWGSDYFKPGVLLLSDINSMNFLLSNKFDLNGATRTIAVNTTSAGRWGGINGVIRNSSGTAGITKIGAGDLQLSGANTYNGVTTVDGGTLTASILASGGAASRSACPLATPPTCCWPTARP